jgi:hypothetical protein
MTYKPHFEKIYTIETTHDRRPKPATLDFFVRDYDEDQSSMSAGFETETRYIINLHCATTFWSDSFSLEQKTQQAKRATEAYLFKGIIPLVHEIILNADNEEVEQIAKELLEKMTGNTE